MTEGKTILDHASAEPDARRPKKFAEIERRQGDAPGAKEMAMTRRRRDEDDATRAARFLEQDRQAED